MHRLLLSAAAAVCFFAAPAAAQDFPMVMKKVDKGLFKPSKIAILSYSINFIVAQQATASSDVMVKARVTNDLAGVDEAVMRRLVNEAHADLKAQMAAAGLALASDAEVQQVLTQSGTVLLPGNTDRGGDGGIVIGKGVKKKFVSFGADAAPLTNLYQAGGKIGGFGAFGKIGAANKLNKPSIAIDSAMISPSLIIDYADSEASNTRTLTGAKRSSASSELQFAVRAMSPVQIQTSTSIGIGFPGTLMLTRDYPSDAPFATSQTDAVTRAGVIGGNSTSGSVTIDLPRWTALVQAAYRGYNAAITRAIVESKGR